MGEPAADATGPATAAAADPVQVVRVGVRRLEGYPDEWALPEYATAGSAAVDLRNAGPEFTLESLERRLVPTGLAIALPSGTEAQIRPRSGLAYKRGVTIVNAPSTIDADYRGEIRIPLINLDRGSRRIRHGERVAQLLVARVARIDWERLEELPATERDTGGFGSTGR